ncbi:MAG: AlkA N-terminal domain-containing protein [Sandaracinus sp.]
MTSPATTHLDARACHRALSARDARFDGTFFVGVSTTGVYCRPICPARTPRADRCRFFALAAEAEREGFRACFRCRPELAPGAAPVDARSRLVAAALAAIERGALERGGVEALARRLGVTSRHLRRTLERELGVTPIELETTRRLAVAKQLLTDTTLPLTRVALGSGFGSVRRFHAAFATRFARRPGDVRREHSARADRSTELVLRLDHRAPFDWAALLAFVSPRAIPGVERALGGAYERAIRIDGEEGWIRAQPWPGRSALRLSLSLSLAPHVAKIARAVRDLFDLDAHPDRIASALTTDPLLAPLVRARPGLRVPGALDPFEIAVRSVLAQQVSLAAATTLSGRLAQALGRSVRTGLEGLDRAFPDAAAIAARTPAELARVIGMPLARGRALHALAEAVTCGAIDLSGTRPSREVVAALEELPGIGPFTAEVIAMRALRDADAFPANDLVIARRLGKHALSRAEAFRPYRAYAALHLWTDEGARR